MSTQKSQLNNYGRYIGRVGALAAALGIGVFAVTVPGVASADISTSDARDASATSSAPASDQSTVGSDTTAPRNRADRDGTEASEEEAAGTEGDMAAPDIAADDAAPDIAADEDVEDAPDVEGAADPAEPETDVTEPVEDETDPPQVDSASPTLPRIQDRAGAGFRFFRPAARDSATTPDSPAPSPSIGIADEPATVADPPSPAAPTTARTAAVFTKDDDAAEEPSVTATVVNTAAVAPTLGVIGFLNTVVTKLLDPFLAAPPETPGPVTPIVWTVLGWVRRNLFNQTPVITYDQTTTSQTGQTVSGSLGATDAEGDALTYTVTRGPQHGTLTIDQATGHFTYTPDDIDYAAAQTDSFTVSVADGKINLLTLFRPHRATTQIDLAVLSPTIERVIVGLPPGFTDAAIPRFAADGHSLLFSATPPDAAAGARREIYQVAVDGSGLTCLTCGLVDPTPLPAGSTSPRTLFKPVPFEDGTGRILMQSVAANGTYTHVVYEPDTNQLVRILTPTGKPGVIATDAQREMRISPDGTHVLFSQIQLVPNPLDPPGFITAVPVVGALTAGTDAAGNKVYTITDARVVYPVGEAKQWTHDGKGVIILGGLYESGNVDDIVVDIATGEVTRLTGNLDYDEDADLSPNNAWITIDSARGLDALTPVTRIVRPAFVPLLIQGSVYTTYRGPSEATNVTNQPWLVAVEDDLDGENGIPLFVSDDPATPEDEGDNWTARSMPSWNTDGTAVAFWEVDSTDPTGQRSRLVVANLKYTTSVGAAPDNSTPPLSSTFPTLALNTPTQVQLIAPGTYTGVGGGTAHVTETTDATTGHIVRTVQYTEYVNDQGMILNGAESTDQSAAQNTIHYIADIAVTGTHTGSLTGDVVVNKLTRTITPTTSGSQIQSTLDGDTLVLLDPVRVAEAQAST